MTRHTNPRAVNPLAELCAEAQRLRGSRIYEGALQDFGHFGQALIRHFAAPGPKIGNKIVALSHSAAAPDRAVASVLALAVLIRFSEFVQRERLALGYRRQWEDPSGLDLLAAIEQCCLDGDENRLIALIAREAVEFFRDVEAPALLVAIGRRLPDFKRLAIESSIPPTPRKFLEQHLGLG